MTLVIFACVHNGGRSQMAAAFFNRLSAPHKARAVSAGTNPQERVHPEVVVTMKEVGIDLSTAVPQRLTPELAATAQILVTMGCGDDCPVVRGTRRDDWPLPDPKGQTVERVRQIRDEIEQRVKKLIASEGWSTPASGLVTRTADLRDAAAIARIYNEGIEDRIATFEIEPREEATIQAWFGGRYPIVVVEKAGQVVAFASSSSSSGRCCYAGNADFGVYVARAERGQGAGAAAMRGLIEQARASGLTKLLSGVFPENEASLGLLRKLGFREVGRYEKHGKLEGAWRDVVLVELVL